jgi:hypothetical protein
MRDPLIVEKPDDVDALWDNLMAPPPLSRPREGKAQSYAQRQQGEAQ